ncbi:MAG: hypothetical protein RLZZ399_412 [Verrucomicrobiota bacterium]
MEYIIHVVGYEDKVRDVLFGEPIIRVIGQVADVVGVARDEIVDSDHSVSLSEETVGEVGT